MVLHSSSTTVAQIVVPFEHHVFCGFLQQLCSAREDSHKLYNVDYANISKLTCLCDSSLEEQFLIKPMHDRTAIYEYLVQTVDKNTSSDDDSSLGAKSSSGLVDFA